MKVIVDQFGNEVENRDGQWVLSSNPKLTYVGDGKYMDNTSRLYKGEDLASGTKPDETNDRGSAGLLDSAGKAVQDFFARDDSKDKKYAEEYYQKASEIVGPNYAIISQSDADRNAKLEEVADNLNIPAEVLRGADENTQDAALRTLNPQADMKDVAENSPLTMMYLSDTDNLARSHDDVATLQWIEESGREISNAMEISDAMHQLNEIDYKAQQDGKTFDELDYETQDNRKRLMARIAKMKEGMPDDIISAFGLASVAGDIWQNAKASGEYAALGATAGAGIGLMAGGIGAIPGALKGAGYGLQVGMATDAGRQAAGQMYRELLKNGAEKDKASTASTISNAGNFLLNFVSFGTAKASLATVLRADKTGIFKDLIMNTLEQGVIGAATGEVQVGASRIGMGEDLIKEFTKQEDETVLNSAMSMAALGALTSIPGLGVAVLSKIRERVSVSHTIGRGEVGRKAIQNFVDKAAPLNSTIDAGRLNASLSELSDEDKAQTLSILGLNAEDLQAQAEMGGEITITSGQYSTLPKSVVAVLNPEMRVNNQPSAHEVVDRQEHNESVYDDGSNVQYDNDENISDEDYAKMRSEESDRLTAELNESVPQEKVHVAREELANEALSGAFGDSVTAEKLIDDFENDRMTPDVEDEFESFAKEHGYQNADAMVKDMKAHPSVEEDVRTRVEEAQNKMDEEYGHDEEAQEIRNTSGDEALDQVLEEAADMEEDVDNILKEGQDNSPESETATKKAGELQVLQENYNALRVQREKLSKELVEKNNGELVPEDSKKLQDLYVAENKARDEYENRVIDEVETDKGESDAKHNKNESESNQDEEFEDVYSVYKKACREYHKVFQAWLAIPYNDPRKTGSALEVVNHFENLRAEAFEDWVNETRAPGTLGRNMFYLVPHYKRLQSKTIYPAESRRTEGVSRQTSRAIVKTENLAIRAEKDGNQKGKLIFNLQLFGHKTVGETEKATKAINDAIKVPSDENIKKAAEEVTNAQERIKKLIGRFVPVLTKGSLKQVIKDEKTIAKLTEKVHKLTADIKFGNEYMRMLNRDKERAEKRAERAESKTAEKVSAAKEKEQARAKKKYEPKIEKLTEEKLMLRAEMKDVKATFKEIQKVTKAIIKALVKETHDTPEQKAAREPHFDIQKKYVKLKVGMIVKGMTIEHSTNFRKFRGMAERCHRNAERHYRRAMSKQPWGNKDGVQRYDVRKEDLKAEANGHNTVETLANHGVEAAKFYIARKKELAIAAKWKQREYMAKVAEQLSLSLFDRRKTLERQMRRAVHVKFDSVGDDLVRYQLVKLYDGLGLSSEADKRHIADFEKTQAKEIKPLADTISKLNKNGAQVDLPDNFEQLIGKGWQNLNYYEAEEVASTIRQIQRASSDVKRMFTDKNRQTVADSARAMAKEINVTEGTVKASAELKDRKYKTWGLLSNYLMTDMQTMDTIIDRIGHNAKQLREFWIDRVHRLSDKESQAMRRLLEGYDKVDEDGNKVHVAGYNELIKQYSKADSWRMDRKEIYSEKLGCSLTKSQMICILLNCGTEENRAKLFGGEIDGRHVAMSIPIEVRDMLNDSGKAGAWNYENVIEFIGENLDSRDINLVNGMWKLLEDMWEPLKKKEYERTGKLVKAKTNAKVELVLKDGTQVSLDGGYYPLSKSAGDLGKQDSQIEVNGVAGMLENGNAMHASTTHGFMKQVTNKDYAVSLDLEAFTRYVTDAVHDYYFRDWVADAFRLYNFEDIVGENTSVVFQEAVRSHGGMAAVNAFKEYIDEIACVDRRDSGSAIRSSISTWLKQASASSAIAMNFGVCVQNLANWILYPGAVKGWGFSDSMHALWKYGFHDYWSKAFSGLVGSPLHPTQWFDPAKAYAGELSPMMYDLVGKPDQTFRDLIGHGFGRDYGNRNHLTFELARARDNLMEFSANFMWFTDSLSSVAMWKGCYEQGINKLGLSKEEAMQRADMLIRRTNGSPRRYDNSAFIRAKPSEFYAFFNTFMGFFNTEANRWMREINQDVRGQIKNYPRFLAFVASRAVLFTFMSNVLMNGGTDDYDKAPGKKIIADALAYPATLFPVSKEFVAASIAVQFGLEAPNTYRPSIQFNTIADMYRFGTANANSRNAKRRSKLRIMAEGGTRVVTDIARMPRPIHNLFWNAVDYENNEFRDWHYTDFWKRHYEKKGT